MISIFLFSESSIRFLIFPASSLFFVRTVVRTVTTGPIGAEGGGGVGLLAHSAVLTLCSGKAEWEGKSQGGEEEVEEEDEEDEEGEGEEREEERE